MSDDENNTPDIYAISGLSQPPETTITPSEHSDIFSVKKDNTDRLGSILSLTLSAGVFLCNAYRLDQRLTQDKIGEHWKAADLRASRNVLVYLPPLEIRKNESAVELIRQAAKQIEALDHPRIIPVLENFVDPEHGFFTVRKFVNGKTLDVFRKEYVKQHGKLTLPHAVKMLSGIAHALDYAHSIGIVHGDLYPNNIIVASDEEVFVDNFALLSIYTDNASAARIPYLPPESADEDTATASSDVYALAAMTYELLSGRLPFSPESMDIPLPIPGVSSAVDAVIQKGLARFPGDRYDSCGDFVNALETSFQEPKKNKPAAKPLSKHSRKKGISLTLWVLTLMFVFTLTGGIVFVQQNSDWVRQMLSNKIEREPVPDMPPSIEKEVIIAEPEQKADPPPAPIPSALSDEPSPGEPTLVVPEETTTEESKSEPIDKPEPPLNVEGEPVPDMPPSIEGEVIIAEPEQKADLPPAPIPSALSGEPSPIVPKETTPEEPKSEPIDKPEPPLNVEPASLPDPEVVPPAPGVQTERTESVSRFSEILQRDAGRSKKLTLGGTGYVFLWSPPCEPITKNGFWILRTAVTQPMWKAVMGTIPQQPADGPRVPVSNVSWDQCQQFIVELNNEPAVLANEDLEGYRFALPTAAQWDYAQNEKIFEADENVLEWCDTLSDTTRNRIVRGDAKHEYNDERDPSARNGYDNVGFRLVIIPAK